MSKHTEPPVLSGDNLCLWRGDAPIIDGLSLQVAAGEVLRLEGENGSGKTTLLRVLAGLIEPDEGAVSFRGTPLPAARQALADALLYIGHRPGVGSALNADENLRVSAAIAADDVDAATRIRVLQELGLGERLDVPVAALSAGQRRRVALSRLAVESKELWLLDEPLTALDTAGLDWVRTRIQQQIENGGTVILTTHQSLELPGIKVRSLTLRVPGTGQADVE